MIGARRAADKARELRPHPASWPAIDQRLLENSRYGMIPVVADGLKPFTVYAADADRAKAAKMPVVSIVIGGLGVGAAKTTDAIMKLPGAVTLAFTPYGADPEKLAERAAPSATRSCCRSRWSPTTIRTTIPGRRRC